jgi:hypothetical protein
VSSASFSFSKCAVCWLQQEANPSRCVLLQVLAMSPEYIQWDIRLRFPMPELSFSWSLRSAADTDRRERRCIGMVWSAAATRIRRWQMRELVCEFIRLWDSHTVHSGNLISAQQMMGIMVNAKAKAKACSDGTERLCRAAEI